MFDGFVVPNWYRTLHSIVPADIPAQVIWLCLVDLAIFSTVGNLANMMMRNMLAGNTPADAWRMTQPKLWPVIKLDWKVFPLYDLVVFSLVPKHVQALCTACVCCLWNGYISSVTAAAAKAKRQAVKIKRL